jgi:hypothetical protein
MLKSRIKNTYQFLLHPDKNKHPEAKATLTFVQRCASHLLDAVLPQQETLQQRTSREERELLEKVEEKERRARLLRKAKLDALRSREYADLRMEFCGRASPTSNPRACSTSRPHASVPFSTR